MKRVLISLTLALIALLPLDARADKLKISPDATSVMADLYILDSSSSTGAGLTGLAYNTASLVCYYHRSNSSSATSITLASATAGTFTSGGFVVVDGTNMPGLYQLGIPNAAFASGAKYVTVMCKGATNMMPVVAEYQIVYADLNEAIPASPTTDSTLDRVKRLTEPDGTAQGGAAGYIDLATSASATNDYYMAVDGTPNTTVMVVGGTGSGQHRCISDYVGSTRRASVANNWVTNPDNTSKYVLISTPNCNVAGGGGGTDWTTSEKQQIRDALGVDGTKTTATGGQLQTLDTVADAILDDTGTSGVVIANGAITSAKFAAGAIDATAIATDAIGSAELSQAAADKVWSTTTRQLTGTQAFNLTGNITGNLSGSVGSVTGAVGSVTAGVTVSTNNDKTGYGLADNAITDAKINSAAGNKIADHVMRRTAANVEASTNGDTLSFQSLYGATAKQTNNVSVSGSNLTIKKADGVTDLKVQTLGTTAGANPITSLGTN